MLGEVTSREMTPEAYEADPHLHLDQERPGVTPLRVHDLVTPHPGQRSRAGVTRSGSRAVRYTVRGCFNPETHTSSGGHEWSTDEAFAALTREARRRLSRSAAESPCSKPVR